jgi:hypothetical protein
MNTKMRRPEGVVLFIALSRSVTDSVCFCRYSEILDYHNVETGGSDNHVMQEFTNGQ